MLARMALVILTFFFEQRKELLLLQAENEKLTVKRFKREVEFKRPAIEGGWLSIHTECDSLASVFGSSSFDVAGNLHLVPQFSERDLDTFFLYLSM